MPWGPGWAGGPLFLTELIIFVLFRRVNLDEGWYLWASKLVYEGKLPYRDFAYTQAPVLPYVYGAFQALFGRGLYQGRILTAILALAAFILSGLVARRLAGRGAVVICWAIWITSFYAIGFYTYTATYALAALLIVLAILAGETIRRDPWRTVAATAFLCAAAGVRLSVLAALPPFAAYLVITAQDRKRTLIWASVATLVSLLAIFGPFLAAGGSRMLYDISGFHRDRMEAKWWEPVVAGSVRQNLSDFPVLLLVGVVLPLAWGLVAAVTWVARRRTPRGSELQAGAGPAAGTARPASEAGGDRDVDRGLLAAFVLALMSIALFIAHLAPRTTGSYYNALALPMLSISGAIVLVRAKALLARSGGRQQVWLALFCGILVANCLAQGRAVYMNGLSWWPPRNQIEVVKQAAELVRRWAPPGSELVTFDTHLALEAGLPIPHGFEMSIFSYHPAWSRERAEKYHVVNNEMLLEVLRSATGVIAFTDFDLKLLYGDRDALLSALHSQHRLAKTVPYFGPLRHKLRIYLPRQSAAPVPQTPLLADLADGVRFLGYDLEERAYAPGESLPLTLYWQAARRPAGSYTVFTHVLDESGRVVAGWDNQPCLGTCPTDTWLAGEVIRDEYEVPLDPALPAGQYRVEVGMYDSTSGQRLPVQSGGTGDDADSVLLGSLHVE